jgi:16S rRNA (uracil1498-N3)-methyltransferase
VGPSEASGTSGWCAAEDATAHVFVEALTDECTITGTDGHHLQRARRVRAGEAMTAADGAGAWRRYEVQSAGRGEIVLAATGPVRVEPELVPSVGVGIALTKALDAVVAKLTELGVARIEPFRAARSVVRWDAARAAAAQTRLATIVREAAAQCRRARLPDVRPVVDLREFSVRRGLVLADRDGVSAAALEPPGPAGWTVLVGPEGGFAPDEQAGLGTGVARLTLGPHVLRAETAPVAAAAVLLQGALPPVV